MTDLYTRSVRARTSALTPREEYARAAELRAEANAQGVSLSTDQALRRVSREPLSNLRRPFRAR